MFKQYSAPFWRWCRSAIWTLPRLIPVGGRSSEPFYQLLVNPGPCFPPGALTTRVNMIYMYGSISSSRTFSPKTFRRLFRRTTSSCSIVGHYLPLGTRTHLRKKYSSQFLCIVKAPPPLRNLCRYYQVSMSLCQVNQSPDECYAIPNSIYAIGVINAYCNGTA